MRKTGISTEQSSEGRVSRGSCFKEAVSFVFMKRFLQQILTKPVQWLVNKFSSEPDKERVHRSLTELYKEISEKNEKKGQLRLIDTDAVRYIIFSDQHKGTKDGSDDFRTAEKNYINALEYYYQENYHLISLGDAEELWAKRWPSARNIS